MTRVAAPGRRAFLARSVGFARRADSPAQRRRIARVDAASCLAAAAQDCARCLDACPKGEVGLAMAGGLPEVQASCDGCGACVVACALVNQPVSIRIVAHHDGAIARRPERPALTEDLPPWL